jgi:4-hydroxybenzoate polyprenyltransferase
MILTKYALLDTLFIQIPERNFQFLILTFSVLSIMAGGYIINDIYDMQIDKIYKSNKVYINSTITLSNSWKAYFFLNSFGLILGLYLSFFEGSKSNSFYFPFIIFILFAYSKYLKRTFILGNLTISYCLSMVIYVTYVFTSEEIIYSESLQKYVVYKINHHDVLGPILTYSLFAFITTFIKEIIKDIENIDSSLKQKAKTLPIIIGENKASMVAIFFTFILFIFIVMFLQLFDNDNILFIYSIIFILLPLTYFLIKLLSAESKKDFSHLRSLMKLIMLLGILSMLLFKFS